MSRGAQHALRRTMEKYMRTCRLILICNSISRLIPPLQSRCLGVRVPLHSAENVNKAIRQVCEAEGRPVPSAAFCQTVNQRSRGNLRRALLMVEAAALNKLDFSGNGLSIPQPDWKLYIDEIVKDILSEQTPRKLHDIRLKFYDLLGQCISGDTILRELTEGLLVAVKPTLQSGLIQLAAQFDHNMKLGTKPIIHLEAFTAGVMHLLKRQ
ncbi:replication factor C subunit 3/5 [Angomonas deanei]|nr:replication factor C subunit 3/5 [Angomonas deanei]|eukprot:EPY39814.1 replication factor C subunit 3/5 [Angomonas deanei]